VQHDRLYYYSAVSWVDSRIGAVLDELDRQALTSETLVVMHADHGWNLGGKSTIFSHVYTPTHAYMRSSAEHGQWQKFTNWETGVRVPLIIRAPWLPNSAGRRSSTLAELVDIYPTTVDLVSGFPVQ
jgi:iduronate 2-sulfatase